MDTLLPVSARQVKSHRACPSTERAHQRQETATLGKHWPTSSPRTHPAMATRRGRQPRPATTSNLELGDPRISHLFASARVLVRLWSYSYLLHDPVPALARPALGSRSTLYSVDVHPMPRGSHPSRTSPPPPRDVHSLRSISLEQAFGLPANVHSFTHMSSARRTVLILLNHAHTAITHSLSLTETAYHSSIFFVHFSFS